MSTGSGLRMLKLRWPKTMTPSQLRVRVVGGLVAPVCALCCVALRCVALRCVALRCVVCVCVCVCVRVCVCVLLANMDVVCLVCGMLKLPL